MRKPVYGRGSEGWKSTYIDGGAGSETDYFLPDAAEEEVDEPNGGSRLPTSYCKDDPAVEIGGCRAIVVDASVGDDITVWVALRLVYCCDPV
jgi:hypothetical protein